MPSERSGRPSESARDLLYATDVDTNALLFAPRELVEEIRNVRATLPGCRIWGDARRSIPRRWFDELVDRNVAPIEQPPDDDAKLDPDVRQDQWPQLRYSQIQSWLPQEVLELGERYDTMLGSGVNLPADDEDEVLETLEDLGYRCTEDNELTDLFDPFDE